MGAKDNSNFISSGFKRLVGGIKNFFKGKGYTDKYDLWEAMHSNEIGGKKQITAQQYAALQWFKTFVKKKEHHVKAKFMQPSMLYIFNYDTPKYESILDYFDTQPLVLVMKIADTSLGKREIGINLHLLPLSIRKLVLYKMYNLNKIAYNAAKLKGNSTDFVIHWKTISTMLAPLGAGFAVRMYIPELRTNTIKFPLDEWERAIFIPSKGYAKISRAQLEKLWQQYVKKMKNSEIKSIISESSHL